MIIPKEERKKEKASEREEIIEKCAFITFVHF